MDAHLIGIELAQLLLKHNSRVEKQRLIKPPEPAPASVAIKQEARTESH